MRVTFKSKTQDAKSVLSVLRKLEKERVLSTSRKTDVHVYSV